MKLEELQLYFHNFFYVSHGHEVRHTEVPGTPDIKAIAEGSNKPFVKQIPLTKKLHPKTCILTDWSLTYGILKYEDRSEIIAFSPNTMF